MVYLDLAELDCVFQGRWLWSTHRPAVARFDRADHLGDPALPLDCAVRDLVEHHSGRRPRGPIRLLTHLRYFGYCFNPVSFYYCFDAAGESVECMVAEVNNTPWGEQHCYVLSDALASRHGGHLSYRSSKAMHVSPFNPMDLTYDWHFSAPGDRLSVHMALHGRPQGELPFVKTDTAAVTMPAGTAKVFDATMRLERAPVSGPQLALALLRFPLMTLQVMLAIHWQALKLWLKRVPVHTHPDKLKGPHAASEPL